MILDLKKGPFEIKDHIIFRLFLEQQDLFAFGALLLHFCLFCG
jgi:hypothetical protein